MADLLLGSFQSVFQLIAGLNAAYYAIKEVSTPKVQGFHRRIERLKSNTAQLHEEISLIQHWELILFTSSDIDNLGQLSNDSIRLMRDIDNFASDLDDATSDGPYNEPFVHKLSLFSAAMGLAALILSSFCPSCKLPVELAVGITVFGFLPIIISFLYHLTVVNRANRTFHSRYGKLAMEWVDLTRLVDPVTVLNAKDALRKHFKLPPESLGKV